MYQYTFRAYIHNLEDDKHYIDCHYPKEKLRISKVVIDFDNMADDEADVTFIGEKECIAEYMDDAYETNINNELENLVEIQGEKL